MAISISVGPYTLSIVARIHCSVVNGNPFAHTGLSVSRGVVVSHAAAEGFKGSHLFFSQGEIKDGQVLGEALDLTGLGNGNGASLHGPAQEDLRGGLRIASGNVSDRLLLDDGWLLTLEIKLNIG